MHNEKLRGEIMEEVKQKLLQEIEKMQAISEMRYSHWNNTFILAKKIALEEVIMDKPKRAMLIARPFSC